MTIITRSLASSHASHPDIDPNLCDHPGENAQTHGMFMQLTSIKYLDFYMHKEHGHIHLSFHTLHHSWCTLFKVYIFWHIYH